MKNDFCIISHNCWGAEVYRELGLPYNTPFVGLFVPTTCFVKLLSNADYWLSQPLTFSKTSKYDFYNTFRQGRNEYYPIGLLGGEIELHFMHYANEEEATEKWHRRLARMPKDQDHWFIELSHREIFNENEIRDFDKLPFRNKVFFSHKKMEGISSLVYLSEFKNAKEVFDGKALYNVSKYYFDTVCWVKQDDFRIKIPKLLVKIFRTFLRRIK